jgi:hypothetical protein
VEQEQSSGKHNGDDNSVVDTNDTDATPPFEKEVSRAVVSSIHASSPAKHHANIRGTTGGSFVQIEDDARSRQGIAERRENVRKLTDFGSH